jgi:hypothetical protein
VKTLRRLLVAATTAALLLSTTIMTAAAATPDSVGLQGAQNLQRIGTTRIAGTRPVAAGSFSLKQEVGTDAEAAGGGGNVHGGHGSPSALPTSAPDPSAQSVVNATGTFHFAGISHFDQRYAGSGAFTNTQFSLEPPDQGLCVGNGFVVETVNTVIRARDAAGNILADATPLNQFFGLAPEIDRNTGLQGDFTSDPKCYFDHAANRWFVTLLQIDVDPPTGAFPGGSHLLIAVSTSGNPTGSWNLFSIDTTHDGSNGGPSHANCPCYGDQPLIGADKYGFYVTTNEFPLFVPGFNGDMVYAMSKAALASGAGGKVSTFFQQTLAEGQAYTMQPATTPAGAAFAGENDGSEYFLSTLEFTGGLDNRIALWSMTDTSTLGSAHPKVKMHLKVLGTETYGMPPLMTQRNGPTPLRAFINTQAGAAFLGITKTKEPLSPLNSNGDAMAQTVYVNGQIWGSLSTIVSSEHGPDRVGVAWFAVTPSDQEKLDGKVAAQGYVSVNRNHLGFPAIAANAAGKVLVAFSLVGPSYFPSAAYSWIDATKGAGDVQVVSWGVGPADGFTGYASYDPQDNGVERWGDYSAATTDEAGNFWFATETINQSCSLNDFVASNFWCGGTRTLLANWGTTIAKVH